MTQQWIKELNNCNHISLDNIRIKYINLIFQFKKKNICLSRQMFFLTIAIFEKYLIKSQNKQNLIQLTRDIQLKIITLYNIAQKIIKKNHYKLNDMKKIFELEFSSLKYIQTQYQILQTIQYQIPQDFTYAALTRSYELYKAKEEFQKSKDLVIKCLVFLEEAVKISCDFSLCPQLGNSIIKAYKLKTINDVRIKNVMNFFKKKKSNKRMATECL